MVNLVSDTDSDCQCLDHLIYVVSEKSLMSWKVVIWVIIDINPLQRFGLIPTSILPLRFKLCIAIMLTIKMIYEGTLVSFWWAKSLWVNYAQIFCWTRKITWLIPERNNTYTLATYIIFENPKSKNIKAFRFFWYLLWTSYLQAPKSTPWWNNTSNLIQCQIWLKLSPQCPWILMRITSLLYPPTMRMLQR